MDNLFAKQNASLNSDIQAIHRRQLRLLKPSSLSILMALACSLPAPALLAVPAVNALPVLNNIASGTATLSSTGNQLTVDQTTDKLIANWNSFNVGSAAKIQFNQPAINSIALNRISGSASEIYGRVNANGQLILVNPAGITFGSTAQVNAASVIASTLNLSDSNFLANNFLFERVSSGGEINNQGSVLGNEGNTVLLASSIKNSGTLRARGGNLSLANGNKIHVNNSNGQVSINQISSVASLIQSTGTLRADRLVTSADQGKIFIVGDRARTGSVVELAGQLTSLNNDIQGKTIHITGDLTANAATSLNAVNAININGTFTQNKNNSELNLTYNPADGLNLGPTSGNAGKITLSGTGMLYKANTVSYQIIQTLAQLQALDSNATTRAGKYVLGLDIDASSTAGTSFNPIGGSISTPFSGVLDGLGHKIDQININKPAKDGVGLFGYALYASIKNLHLSNATVIGKNNVGGLIGYNGNDNGSTGHSWISNSSVSGTLTGYNQLGGFIGSDNVYNLGSSSIVGSNSNSTITGRYTRIGGLTGYANISNGSLNLSGNSTNSIIQASTVADSKYDIGGLIGRLDLSNHASASLSSLHSNGSVSSLSRPAFNVSGGVGIVNNSDSTLTLNDVNNHSSVSAIHVVFSINTSIISKTVGGLIGQLALSGTASSQISNSSNDGRIEGVEETGGLVGLLSTANTASSLITSSSNQGRIIGADNTGGLVGYSIGGFISNSSSSGELAPPAGADHVLENAGGLVGYQLGGTISNSHSEMSLLGTGELIGGLVGINDAGNILDSYSTGQINAYSGAGGIVGHNSGNINNSYATGIINSENGSGGLAGSNSGTITNSYATGDVDATQAYDNSAGLGGLVGINTGLISHSYATGDVKGKSGPSNDSIYSGGLVGINREGTVEYSYATGDVSGTNAYLGGLIGESINGAVHHNYATGNVTTLVTDVALTGYAGGLIGQAVNFSPSNTPVNIHLNINNNYATGNVSGVIHVGGLIGAMTTASYNNNNDTSVTTLSNNYATGSVSKTSGFTGTASNFGGLIGNVNVLAGTFILDNHYSTGAVDAAGASNVGAFIGRVNVDVDTTTSINNNYWNSTVAGPTAIGTANLIQPPVNLTGLTDAQMTQQSSFVGWDISNQLSGSNSIWYINDGVSAPVLRSFLNP